MKSSTKNCDVKIFPNVETLNKNAASLIVEIAAETLQRKDEFSIALAGGSTPEALYKLLASDKFKTKIDWTKTLVFFGDERCVSPDDAASNYRMANAALLARVPLPPENVFRLKGEIESEKAAAEYEEIIKKTLGESARFDLILLGMGDDGHTASLFPQTPVLRETKKLVAANFVEKLNANRLTLTFPAINSAKNVLFLVAGAKKAPMIKKVFSAETIDLPASLIKPENGNCRWFLDKEAASLIEIL
ncbi:MAG TPA: 6-phosphogluconolactonase [Pyrinomonadaceae bacterium]|nr:6-phosphogluconolactonase [Pyrinomonadaceae bacterium]